MPVTGLSQLRETEVGELGAACRLGAGPGTWTDEQKIKQKGAEIRKPSNFGFFISN